MLSTPFNFCDRSSGVIKMLTAEQERVRSILLDTVALLCKNSLSYRKELKVQGLIGITMDEDDIFLVHINECFQEAAISIKQEELNQGSSKLISYDEPERYAAQPAIPKRLRVQTSQAPITSSRPQAADANRFTVSNNSGFNSGGDVSIKCEQYQENNMAGGNTFGTSGQLPSSTFRPGLPAHVNPGMRSMHTAEYTAGVPGGTTVSRTIVTESYTTNMLDNSDNFDDIQVIPDDDDDDVQASMWHSPADVKPMYPPDFQLTGGTPGLMFRSPPSRPPMGSTTPGSSVGISSHGFMDGTPGRGSMVGSASRSFMGRGSLINSPKRGRGFSRGSMAGRGSASKMLFKQEKVTFST